MASIKERIPIGIRQTWWETRELPAWLLSARRRRDAARLAELRDRHRGQRCVIIGNGPSLREMDLSPLANELTIGLNRIYLLFEKIGFATTYHVTVNRLVIEQYLDDLLAVPSVRFMSWKARDLVPASTPVILLRSLYRPGFSTNLAWGAWEGATVTYTAMQLAYHLGFEQAILIGVDHNFESKGAGHTVVTSQGSDPNHFDPNYFGKGARWQLPDLETSEMAYRMARRAFEAAGRQIVDATVGGRLQVFPKVDYNALFRG
jgi:hypothetical protein